MIFAAWTALKLFWGTKVSPETKAFLANLAKWILVIGALLLAFWYSNKQSDTRGYNRGVAETEKKYKDAANAEQTKTIVQERTVKQYITKKTDADLQSILDWWMLPSSQGTDTSR